MSDEMLALRFYGPRDLRAEKVDRPEPPTNNLVRVQVRASGVCGSDLHVYETAAYVTQFPVTMGHEFAGTVLQVGEAVQGLAPGDHVVGDSRVFCGQCESCERGSHNLCQNLGFVGEVCDGAYAEEIEIKASSLVPIARHVPMAIAALAEPLAVAIRASRMAHIDAARTVLILGAGPIGALIHTVLTLQGHKQLRITDVSDYRRAVVAAVAPDSVLTTADRPYDVVFETTGAEKAVRHLLPEYLAKGGQLIMVGLFRAPIPFDFNHIVEGEWSVRGSSAFSSELPESVQVLEQHWQHFGHIVSHQMSLRDYQKALDLLLSPEKKAMKIVFTP